MPAVGHGKVWGSGSREAFVRNETLTRSATKTIPATAQNCFSPVLVRDSSHPMLPFALTIFTGAFLLFQVQPLIGKFILPWFGGSPGVWTTCLLFFQTLLLGGYAYAHFTSTRLKPRQQATVHLVLLVLALALLPITPAETWKAHLAGNPVWHIMLLLTVCVGLPYFVLSSTGPLLQQWFSLTHPGVSPYRLYALSNFGSLLALLSYPFYFERVFSRQTQANLWSGGLLIFVACCGYCAWRVRRSGRGNEAGDDSGLLTSSAKGDETEEVEEPSFLDKSLWLGLPAVASILLLATTNKLCMEVAVVPFLAMGASAEFLYLLSFIICFDHARWYRRGPCAALFIVGIAAVCHVLVTGNSAPLLQQVIAYTGTLFVACLICHGELYRLRPPPRHLTGFYLFIAAGGLCQPRSGGVSRRRWWRRRCFRITGNWQVGLWALSYLLGVLCFRQRSRSIAWGVALGAIGGTLVVPALRTTLNESLGYWDELQGFYRQEWEWVAFGVLVFGCCLVDFGQWRWARAWRVPLGVFVMSASVALGMILLVMLRGDDDRTAVSATRNFYGTLKVFEYRPDEPESHYYLLMHGATTHGLQFANPPQSRWPTTYYAKTSGVGLAIAALPPAPGRRLGLVGLGTGTLSAYGRAGDYLRIYEINPAVEQLARSRFTYLKDCPAKVDVIMGDARISMEREVAEGRSQQFDLLALDAFNSDAIPVHLLTKESVALYLRELKPDGVLAVHTSNRYLDLRPVVENLAREYGLGVAVIPDDDEDDWWVYRTTWILVTKNRALLAEHDISKVTEHPVPPNLKVGVWTDDHASLYEILRQ